MNNCCTLYFIPKVHNYLHSFYVSEQTQPPQVPTLIATVIVFAIRNVCCKYELCLHCYK